MFSFSKSGMQRLQSESVEDMEKEIQRGNSECQEEMHPKGAVYGVPLEENCLLVLSQMNFH